jgi:hypothetical protein
MIAPIRRFIPRRRQAPRGLASARRAVAAVLFSRVDPPAAVQRSRLSNYRTWALLAAMAAIAAVYFAFGPW